MVNNTPLGVATDPLNKKVFVANNADGSVIVWANHVLLCLSFPKSLIGNDR
ncbi:MAG: hypothetical protein ABFR82_13660 [Nitrospirota bacterium]